MANFVACGFHLIKSFFKQKKKKVLFQAEKLEWDEIIPGTEI